MRNLGRSRVLREDEVEDEEEDTGVKGQEKAWLPGATRAPPTVTNHGRREKTKLNTDVILHIINSNLLLYWLQIILIKLGAVGVKET